MKKMMIEAVNIKRFTGTDDEYYQLPMLSASKLKEDGSKAFKNVQDAMLIGNICHHLFFFDTPLPYEVPQNLYIKGKALADALLASKKGQAFKAEAKYYELAATCDIRHIDTKLGLPFKAKCDALPAKDKDYLLDLKTCRGDYVKSFNQYRYDLQMTLYCLIFNKKQARLLFINKDNLADINYYAYTPTEAVKAEAWELIKKKVTN